MNLHDLGLFSSGAIFLGFAIIGLFFLQFWRETRERLLGWFATAFFILAAEQALLLLNSGADMAYRPLVYCTRLLAFVVIVWAILDKNRSRD